MTQLGEVGFFVTTCMPVWYTERGRHFRQLFKEAVPDAVDPLFDQKRGLSMVHEDDVLFKLITEPVMKRMRELGVLGIVDETSGKVDGREQREVGSCAVLKSEKRPTTQPGPQGFHVDTPPSHDWKNKFCFSSITAGSRPAKVDIYPRSFDGQVKSVHPVTVTLPPGQTLVFNGLARHRGTSYSDTNVRFFVSIVVKEEVENAEKGNHAAQTCELQVIPS